MQDVLKLLKHQKQKENKIYLNVFEIDSMEFLRNGKSNFWFDSILYLIPI